MANFGGYSIPSFSATVNVVWETLKAKWPENSPCMELIRNAGGGGGGGGGQARPVPGDFKSFGEGGENTEMREMTGEQAFGGQSGSGMAEDSFSYQRNGYVIDILDCIKSKTTCTHHSHI